MNSNFLRKLFGLTKSEPKPKPLKNMLLSAAIGDISGQPYEFDRRTKDYNEVDLLLPNNGYTNNIVCTFACAKALLRHKNMEETLKRRGREYFRRFFDGRYYQWPMSPKVGLAYGSFGNGSAIRCSAAGFMAKNKKECIDLATQTAAPTHNHPEGIKGAVVTALAIHCALRGNNKAFIRKHVLDWYYPEWSGKTYKEIKPGYDYNETCQQTVPAALICFLESKDYVDCLKLAIALGGDADALGAIAGPMAYAYYKEMPDELVENAKRKLPKWMLELNDEFDKYCRKATNRLKYNDTTTNEEAFEYHGIARPRFTPNKLSELKPDEVFVFGSNLQGCHGGGAARAAMERFGAEWGNGVGMQGQSYAIPTMQGGVETIKPYVDEFVNFAKQHEEYFFYVTRIGCGIAGFKDEDIAPLFWDAQFVENICLPENFAVIIKPTLPKETRQMMYGQMRTLVDLLKAFNKEKPLTNVNEGMSRIKEVLNNNVRYCNESMTTVAFRTIESLLRRNEYDGNGIVILDKLEKDLYDFNAGNPLKVEDAVCDVMYKYSISKIVKYIQFLNDFRRYTKYDDIEKDLWSISTSGFSPNDRNSYFAFCRYPLFLFSSILAKEWNYIAPNGRLDNDLLEEVVMSRYQKAVGEYGVAELIRRSYEINVCHPNIRGPRMYDADEPIYGPFFRINGKQIEKGCSDFRSFPGESQGFEMRFASELLNSDENYIQDNECGWHNYYIPRQDDSLPVYSRIEGKLHFESDDEKKAFINKYRGQEHAD